jgi:hypothetical protein
MNCAEFLQMHAEARDGQVRDPAVLAELEDHLERCRRCGRLAEMITEGLLALQTEDIAPTGRFRKTLDQRLRAEVALGDPIMPTHAGLAAALLMASAVGLLLYQAFSRTPAKVATAQPAPAVTAPFAPDHGSQRSVLVDVTLPAFTHSQLEFHSSQTPLGSFAALGR